jgi:hypothetical protein
MVAPERMLGARPAPRDLGGITRAFAKRGKLNPAWNE